MVFWGFWFSSNFGLKCSGFFRVQVARGLETMNQMASPCAQDTPNASATKLAQTWTLVWRLWYRKNQRPYALALVTAWSWTLPSCVSTWIIASYQCQRDIELFQIVKWNLLWTFGLSIPVNLHSRRTLSCILVVLKSGQYFLLFTHG